MKRIITVVSVVASIALFGFIFFLISTVETRKSYAPSVSDGVSNHTSLTATQAVPTNEASLVGPNVSSPSAGTTTMGTAVPQPTQTTKAS
jgi:hypothetical protein